MIPNLGSSTGFALRGPKAHYFSKRVKKIKLLHSNHHQLPPLPPPQPLKDLGTNIHPLKSAPTFKNSLHPLKKPKISRNRKDQIIHRKKRRLDDEHTNNSKDTTNNIRIHHFLLASSIKSSKRKLTKIWNTIEEREEEE